MAHPTASSGGPEGDQVFDGKVGASPDSTAPPGKTNNGDVAFGAQSLDDLTTETPPGFSDDHTVWPS
jgi:hypothetical protein